MFLNHVFARWSLPSCCLIQKGPRRYCKQANIQPQIPVFTKQNHLLGHPFFFTDKPSCTQSCRTSQLTTFPPSPAPLPSHEPNPSPLRQHGRSHQHLRHINFRRRRRISPNHQPRQLHPPRQFPRSRHILRAEPRRKLLGLPNEPFVKRRRRTRGPRVAPYRRSATTSGMRLCD